MQPRARVFAITWITYAGYYLCRKNLSIVLPALHGASGAGNLELANIVFGYSLLYAIGQFGFGFLSDSIGAKRVVGGGLLLVVGSNLLMSTPVSCLPSLSALTASWQLLRGSSADQKGCRGKTRIKTGCPPGIHIG